MRSIWLALLIVVPAIACNADDDENCPIGGEGCLCTSGGGCDSALTCLSNRCVRTGAANCSTDTDCDGNQMCTTDGCVDWLGSALETCTGSSICEGVSVGHYCALTPSSCKCIKGYCATRITSNCTSNADCDQECDGISTTPLSCYCSAEDRDCYTDGVP